MVGLETCGLMHDAGSVSCFPAMGPWLSALGSRNPYSAQGGESDLSTCEEAQKAPLSQGAKSGVPAVVGKAEKERDEEERHQSFASVQLEAGIYFSLI